MSPWELSGSALSRFSLHRRVSVFVLVVSAVVVGAVAALAIPLELVPRGLTNPFLHVYAPWPDAPPREAHDKITVPLEDEMSTVRGLDRIVSVSRTGAAQLFLWFKQGTDMDLAYREVRDRIERSRRGFPEDVEQVFIFKEDASGVPVYVLGVAVDEELAESYDLIQNEIVRRLERVDGVASIEAEGLEEKEIIIELDRERVAAAGLNIYAIAQELRGDNFTMAAGHVREGGRKLLLRSVARYGSLEELERRLVAPGVRLRDVARIRYEEPDKRYRVRAMSKPAYALVVFKEGQANAQEVCRRIDEVVERMRRDPRLKDVDIITIFSQGDFIEESLSTLFESGMIGALIALGVLFVFLRRLRMTLVITLSIPLSLLVAITVMYFAGETLNVITLLALMVSVGLLVDNSVVVAENIHRLYREGASREEAAVRGAAEIALAIAMSTLTTIVVFLPVALVEGQAQFFFMRLALPVSVSLLASLAVALVVVPLAVYLTLDEKQAAAGALRSLYERLRAWLRRLYEGSFGRLARAYGRALAFFLDRRLDLVLALAAVFAVTGVLSSKYIEFVEVQEDERPGFQLTVELPENTSFEETERWFLAAEKAIESHAAELGLEGWFHFHRRTTGEIQGWFTHPRTTDLSPREVTERVMEFLPKKAGLKLYTGDEREAEQKKDEATESVVVQGEDPELLERVVEQLEPLFASVEGVLGVRRSFERQPNELGLVVDRARARQYGVDPRIVAGVVGYALRGASLPRYLDQGREVPVRVRFEEADRRSLAELADFRVPTASGALLPLGALVDARMLASPEAIVRRNKRLARSITLELEEGREQETRRRIAALQASLDLPEGVRFGADEAQQGFEEDIANLKFAGVVSVLFIYLLMAFLFESFVLPLSIILTIPLASIGVIWIHLATGRDIDFLGAVGLVLLVGVVVNNGIVLIDYVNRLRGWGMERREALERAAERRFRPIMMTAITTIGGLVPLAIAGRADSGISYTSFALTLIGGMTTATLLTLLVVPVFYTFFDDLRETLLAGLARLRRRPAPAQP